MSPHWPWGWAMTTKGTILKLGAFSAVIRETRLLWVTVTRPRKGCPAQSQQPWGFSSGPGMTGDGRIPPPQDANAPISCSTTPAPQTQHQEEGESELIHLQREQTDLNMAPDKDPDL